MGFDKAPSAVSKAQQNVINANLDEFIGVHHINFFNSTKEVFGNTTILFNPPYGERIGDLPELVESFALLGQTFKAQFVNWRIAVLTANVELLAMMKMVTLKRYKFKNGPLDCQFALYNLDDKQVSSSNVNAEFEQKKSDFGNRLLKNKKNLKNWLKQENIECYRLYDADIPEYNVAVDVYGDHLVIHEYTCLLYTSPSPRD